MWKIKVLVRQWLFYFIAMLSIALTSSTFTILNIDSPVFPYIMIMNTFTVSASMSMIVLLLATTRLVGFQKKHTKTYLPNNI